MEEPRNVVTIIMCLEKLKVRIRQHSSISEKYHPV